MKEKHYLIVYDIRDVRRLNKVMTCVSSYARRVQKSVYEATLSDEVIRRLKARLRRLTEDEDFVLFFEICERDWQKREWFGKEGENTFTDEKFRIL